MKKVVILGSTGSIGVNTLQVIRDFKEHFKITALTANSNIDLLERQMEEFNPEFVAVSDIKEAEKLRKRIDGRCKLLPGEKGLNELAAGADYDIMVSSLVGFAGLAPTLEGIKRKKRIALANKETLVAAGEYVNNMLEKYGAEMIPVDSEHSAIFQCLTGEKKERIEKLILTASGGPFLNHSAEELENVTIENALDHPNWKMGNKITIDSASMMNKGLEIIEAHWLFDLPPEKIDVVIHPQSVIHSMVQFVDASIKAQLSMPDMKLPIQYALTWPDRFESSYVETNFPRLGSLTFLEPDMVKFRCLKLAYDSLEQGGLSSCILNAANEIAVELFLKEIIKFSGIPDVISDALDKIENRFDIDPGTIFETDRLVREYVYNKFNQGA